MQIEKIGTFAKHIHAFSLIELMVVVSIIGLLSAVAMPSYQNYMIRSKVAALLPLVEPAKVNIMEGHSYGKVYGTSTAVLIAHGSSPMPQYLYEMDQAQYGCIEIKYDLTQINLASGTGQALNLLFCPSDSGTGALKWTCGYSSDTTVAYAVYLPQNCQQLAVQSTTF